MTWKNEVIATIKAQDDGIECVPEKMTNVELVHQLDAIIYASAGTAPELVTLLGDFKQEVGLIPKEFKSGQVFEYLGKNFVLVNVLDRMIVFRKLVKANGRDNQTSPQFAEKVDFVKYSFTYDAHLTWQFANNAMDEEEVHTIYK